MLQSTLKPKVILSLFSILLYFLLVGNCQAFERPEIKSDDQHEVFIVKMQNKIPSPSLLIELKHVFIYLSMHELEKIVSGMENSKTNSKNKQAKIKRRVVSLLGSKKISNNGNYYIPQSEKTKHAKIISYFLEKGKATIVYRASRVVIDEIEIHFQGHIYFGTISYYIHDKITPDQRKREFFNANWWIS